MQLFNKLRSVFTNKKLKIQKFEHIKPIIINISLIIGPTGVAYIYYKIYVYIAIEQYLQELEVKYSDNTIPYMKNPTEDKPKSPKLPKSPIMPKLPKSPKSPKSPVMPKT
jgi:hypothetical protein